MPQTPDTIINGPLRILHHALIIIGLLFGLATIGAMGNGGNFLIPALFAGLAFFGASKIKYKWKHQATASVYK